MKCPKCNKEMGEEASKFCPFCGASIAVQNVPSGSGFQQPQQSNTYQQQSEQTNTYQQQPRQVNASQQFQQNNVHQRQSQQVNTYSQPNNQYVNNVQPQVQEMMYQHNTINKVKSRYINEVVVLVFGIISVCTWWIPFVNIAGIVLGAIAIHYGSNYNQEMRGVRPELLDGRVKAGFIMGIIGTIICSLFTFIYFIEFI